MAQQVVKAYFNAAIPSSTSWSLFDASGIQSAGVTSTSQTVLVMSVTVGLPIDHTYHLALRDTDGALLESVSFHHADGGIIIVDNVDIGKGPIKPQTVQAVKTKG